MVKIIPNTQKDYSAQFGRLFILSSALLWSLSGSFTRIIGLPGPVMAFYRVLFAGLFLFPILLNKPKITWRPAFWGMAGCFALMNLTFVSALTLTSAANAVFLQYIAPAFMVMGSVWFFKESPDRQTIRSLILCFVGMLVILVGGWKTDFVGMSLAILAGLAYAGVGLFLRYLRDEDPVVLTVINHLSAALLVFPMLLLKSEWHPWPIAGSSILLLIAFGILQMGLPYILFALGLRRLSAQEASLITLVEPVANPVLTYIVVSEIPSPATILGGSIILMGVAFRYLGRRVPAAAL